jgi:hypothetical protein
MSPRAARIVLLRLSTERQRSIVAAAAARSR